MNAIGHRLAILHATPMDAHSTAETELARHHFDLRIHALVMTFSAVAAGYCGISVLGFNDSAISADSARVMTMPDILSLCALTLFFAIAIACLLEAYRGWRKALAFGARQVGLRIPSEQPSARASRQSI